MTALPPNLSLISSASQAVFLCSEEEHGIASRLLTQAAQTACALVPRHRFPFWCGVLAHLF
jgi:hypothetical protein